MDTKFEIPPGFIVSKCKKHIKRTTQYKAFQRSHIFTFPLTLWMGSTTTATARSDRASKLCWVLMSTPDNQQPNPGWLWYHPTTISGLMINKGRRQWRVVFKVHWTCHTINEEVVEHWNAVFFSGLWKKQNYLNSVKILPASLFKHVQHLGLEHRVHCFNTHTLSMTRLYYAPLLDL